MLKHNEDTERCSLQVHVFCEWWQLSTNVIFCFAKATQKRMQAQCGLEDSSIMAQYFL